MGIPRSLPLTIYVMPLFVPRSGAIPSTLWALPALEWLSLSGNMLSGEIENQWRECVSFVVVYIYIVLLKEEELHSSGWAFLLQHIQAFSIIDRETVQFQA